METVNQEVNATQEQQEAKFTQADLDRIVKDRLTREREKYGDYDALKAKADKFDEIEEASKTELQKAQERAQAVEQELNKLKQANELRDLRQKIATETGVPVHLLTATSEEDLKTQAGQIMDFARPGYPVVRDGGEIPAIPPVKKSTADQFADWFSKL